MSEQLSLFPGERRNRRLICRPWITVRGKRIYAKSVGKKAFCFYVED